jgi:flavin-dependent dehydrogenase
LGVDLPGQGPRRFGLRRHYAIRPWTDVVEVHWGRTAEAYVTPVSDELIGVALLFGAVPASYDELLQEFPLLHSRLRSAAPVGEVLGAGPLRRRVSSRTVGRVLLLGDAAGYVDALTGEGLAVGLAGARAAVQCIAADRVSDYDRAWRSLTRRSRVLTEGLVGLALHGPTRRAIVPFAQAAPRVFAAGVHALS